MAFDTSLDRVARATIEDGVRFLVAQAEAVLSAWQRRQREPDAPVPTVLPAPAGVQVGESRPPTKPSDAEAFVQLGELYRAVRAILDGSRSIDEPAARADIAALREALEAALGAPITFAGEPVRGRGQRDVDLDVHDRYTRVGLETGAEAAAASDIDGDSVAEDVTVGADATGMGRAVDGWGGVGDVPSFGVEAPEPVDMRSLGPPSRGTRSAPRDAANATARAGEDAASLSAKERRLRSDSADGAATPTRHVRRDIGASFPTEVEAGSVHPVRFLIGRRLEDGVAGTVDLDVPLAVSIAPLVVTLHAPAFQIVKPAGPANGGSPFIELALDLDSGDSSVGGEFLLRARPTDAPRDAAIQLDIWYRYLPVGQLRLETTVTPRVRHTTAEARGVGTAPATSTGTARLSASAPPGADVTLVIREEHAGEYSIEATTSRVFARELGTFPAGQNAWIYASTLFDRFREAGTLPPAARLDRVVGLGIDLWKNLPKAFHDFYWSELAGRDISIAIYSEEPYIPWELIRPPAQSGVTPGFLGSDFRVARWRTSRDYPDPLAVADFVVIAPTYVPPLEETAVEAGDLAARFGARIVDGTYEPVKASLSSPDIHVFHFAGHGTYVDQRPAESRIELADIHLYPSDIETFRQSLQPGPFVFLNACEVGERGWSFTGIGGWADTFCGVGCTGFIGPYWKVNDSVAHQAAIRFYAALAAGRTVAEAAREIRLGFDAPGQHQHHPSWLAYSLHCPPNIHVTLNDHG
jgi:CHAT domain